MDIGKAFTFIGADPKWGTKLLIGGGLLVLGYLAFLTIIGWLFVFAIVLGYLTQLTRNIIVGEQQPLPDWVGWGTLMRDGFKAMAVSFVVLLPIVALGLPAIIAGVVLADSGYPGTSNLGACLVALGYCLVFPPSPLSYLLLPVAIGRYAATQQIGESLRPKAFFDTLGGAFGTYLLVVLLTFVVTQFIGYLGLVACGIGLPFTLFYSLLVNHHLYGQAYRQASGVLPGDNQPPQPYPPALPS